MNDLPALHMFREELVAENDENAEEEASATKLTPGAGKKRESMVQAVFLT